MKIMIKKLLITLLILVFSQCQQAKTPESEIYIRLNQLGFLPGDYKTAVVLSNENLAGQKYYLINESGRNVAEEVIPPSKGSYGNFKYAHHINFTRVRVTGTYSIRINNAVSYNFQIGHRIYNQVVDDLIKFYKVQRSGYTDPSMHGVSHIADVTSLIDGNRVVNRKVDATGGWYDAGDYTKFVNTTAYVVYTLLFAYEFDPVKFGFDNNSNNVPDILEEAKIGIDYLHRATIQFGGSFRFITQVQDERDQNVGWRLPENDPLTYDRPGFVGIGKNLVGIYVAAMSSASRIWRDVIKYPEYSNKCLTAAENLYSIRNLVPNVDKSGTGVYQDSEFWGKLALGAIELYNTTRRNSLLDEAKLYADSAKSDYWWSWGNINSYAHYKIAAYDKAYGNYILNNLMAFEENQSAKIFNEGTSYSWGTNNTLLGVSLQAVLWKRLNNNSSKYDKLAVLQRDFVLGRNPWGVSFIYDIGEHHTENFHHQVAYFNGGRLPGGFAAGPVSKEFLDEYNIPYETDDKYEKFQTEFAVYRDDRHDYITNEPTITANATAIFVMGYYSHRK